MERKIAIIGAGYVGMANALSFAMNNENVVYVYDVDPKKVMNIQQGKYPSIENSQLTKKILGKDKIKIKGVYEFKEAVSEANIIIIAVPTNFDEKISYFNTRAVEETINLSILHNSKAIIVIRSTLPIGFTTNVIKKTGYEKIIYCPEFLREGKSLYDSLYPERIIIGGSEKLGKRFAYILRKSILKKKVPFLYVKSEEAEAIKLFSNAYLALRVAFFNELSTFAECLGLNTKKIIEGVCLDPRIGNFYNNPSFGFGGYCLPKDTKQLISNFEENNIPYILIKSIIESNNIRKKYIAENILKLNPEKVGIYRLISKSGGDNFRESPMIDIIKILHKYKCKIIIYEPLLSGIDYNFNNKIGFNDYKILNDLNDFKKQVDLIIANRVDHNIEDVLYKVYTADIFHNN